MTVTELVRLTEILWGIEHDCRDLKTGRGLDHFEGRSYAGWHRGVTLAVLVQAICTMLRLNPRPRAGLSLHAIHRELQHLLALIAAHATPVAKLAPT
jgi:hypothetical protein